MSFARHVRDIPTPTVYAWNASEDNPVGAPYILQEWYEYEDVVEPWEVWKKVSDEQRLAIFDDLARWHAALLRPLPPHLGGVGDLVFAPSIEPDADLSDPRSYIVRPLHCRVQRPHDTPRVSFQSSSTSLRQTWDEMLRFRHNLALPPEQCNLESLNTIFLHVQKLVHAALSNMDLSRPEYASTCLVRDDYAFRNVLLDAKTHRVKAFIDWDDVYILPYVLGVTYPEDMMHFFTELLDPEAQYFRDGEFPDLPPDEHGAMTWAYDENGKYLYHDENGKCNGLEFRDGRIQNTALREEYLEALRRYDERLGNEEMWEVRKDVIRAHYLVKRGAASWWRRREWLAENGQKL